MFASEAAILFSVDQCVHILISKDLFRLLIDHKPGVLVRVVFVCRRKEGQGESHRRERAAIKNVWGWLDELYG